MALDCSHEERLRGLAGMMMSHVTYNNTSYCFWIKICGTSTFASLCSHKDKEIATVHHHHHPIQLVHNSHIISHLQKEATKQLPNTRYVGVMIVIRPLVLSMPNTDSSCIYNTSYCRSLQNMNGKIAPIEYMDRYGESSFLLYDIQNTL